MMRTEALNRLTTMLGLALLALALAVVAPTIASAAIAALDEARRWLAELGPSLMPDLTGGGAIAP